MIYFSRITAIHWTAKNNAQKQAKELAMEMDRHMVEEQVVKNWLQIFELKIYQINLDNPRCKPLKLDVWEKTSYGHFMQKDISLCVSDVFQMELFEVKNNLSGKTRIDG